MFIAFLFPLRVPSETLRLRRAFADDPIAEFADHPANALIGVRRVGAADFLSVKLAWRKNLDGGCILKRTCLCDAGASVGARIRPPPPSPYFAPHPLPNRGGRTFISIVY